MASSKMVNSKILSTKLIELNKSHRYTLSKDKVLKTLQSQTDDLTENEITKTHSNLGYNEIVKEKKFLCNYLCSILLYRQF